MLSLCANASSQPWPPLFNGSINDALLQLSPDTGKAMLQIIDVPNCCLIDAFLYSCISPQILLSTGLRSVEFAGQTSGPMKSGVSRRIAARRCPVHGMQVHCPAGIWRSPLTYAEYLATSAASRGHLGSMHHWSWLQALRRTYPNSC